MGHKNVVRQKLSSFNLYAISYAVTWSLKIIGRGRGRGVQIVVGVSASMWIKEEIRKLKIDLSKNIAQKYINYVLNKWLFQLKVGHDSHTKNYYKEKLYKLSFYFRYLHQYQPSSELLLTKYRNQIPNEIFDSIAKFPWTIYQLLQNNSPCREYAKPLEPFLVVSGFTF